MNSEGGYADTSSQRMVSGAASWTHRFLGAGAGAEARASDLLYRPRLKSGLEGGLLPLLATPKLLLADASLLMGWASCTACLTAQAAIAGAQLSQSCTMGFRGGEGRRPGSHLSCTHARLWP